MRWGIDGGQAVLTFRALAQSDRFDNAWRLVSQMYKKHISLPENVVALPVRNRA
jgi:pentatricopeptide repeat protein